jgi:hypothetical protein
MRLAEVTALQAISPRKRPGLVPFTRQSAQPPSLSRNGPAPTPYSVSSGYIGRTPGSPPEPRRQRR